MQGGVARGGKANESHPMKTIVLFSGGLDSATILAALRAQGDECLALGFDYGQPHRIELDRATELAAHYQTPFEIVAIPAMPRVDDVVFAGRNLVFVSIAIAMAQARGFDRVAVGCNASDWERFPDCRPRFWREIERIAETYGVKVATPLIYMSKTEVVQLARRLAVPIEKTWSCYSPDGDKPCQQCLACKVRAEALASF